MRVGECMKRSVISIPVEATARQAAALFAEHHIGTLPVVNGENRLVGIVGLHDVLALVMPDFVNLLEHLNFIHDFGALEKRLPRPEELDIPVSKIMEAPISVEETAGLMRAAALLQHSEIDDLPVVDKDGRLVGIASQVDIGVALIDQWNLRGQS
jgi:CBS domain-containing protein